ncbi:NAD(P)H-dependent flavin oxidoreductase [Minwuia thermotolerans]|uniref:Monooxygenase n=1 Tax=Minwuia thermotolerans TaxID=2056226 RepID=A0A2M9G561_9PROT|nr:nitronate monooxygenase [Minwuia thermotolerans]PJK30806.1 monooxygenase [Minwuia thermotolerans]
MKSPICEMLGIEFPLLAFSHCRDVVVEVSKAGGMGVLGAAGMSAEKLEQELNWIDAHIGGRPYGVDLIVPAKFASKGQTTKPGESVSKVPEEHRAFVRNLLEKHGIDPSTIVTEERLSRGTRLGDNMGDQGAGALLDVCFAHPIRLIANALGTPPPYMTERAKREGVPVAALVGAKEHAIKQVEADVDILVVAGGEAGGHCGDVSTLVLVPEIVQAVKPIRDVPILAAGGIVTGRQMAACMAMGADGAWTGSVWLTTTEAETSPVVKEKYLAASSRDTIRSKARTGKYSRQLRSAWTDAWEAEGAPAPLPMPYQSIITEPVMGRVTRLAEGGHEGAKQLASYFVGQGVGMMNETLGAGQVVQAFKEDFLGAWERMTGLFEE